MPITLFQCIVFSPNDRYVGYVDKNVPLSGDKSSYLEDRFAPDTQSVGDHNAHCLQLVLLEGRTPPGRIIRVTPSYSIDIRIRVGIIRNTSSRHRSGAFFGRHPLHNETDLRLC